MILTRSIRRKLAIWLVVVLAMLVFLSSMGFSALWAYWNVVDNLKYSRDEEPHPSELAAAIDGLVEALYYKPEDRSSKVFESVLSPSSGRLELGFNAKMWDERRKKVSLELRQLYDRTDHHSRTPGSLIQSYHGLSVIQKHLESLDEKRASLSSILIEKPEKREPFLVAMLLDLAELQTLVHQIPNSISVLDQTLHRSGIFVKQGPWWIGGTTVIVMGSFFGLIYLSYHWILVPIRQLHEAASRVANGDFTYRLKLKGKDEMVELGEMFNKMTERFQTDKSKLAQEVEERSRQILRNERLAGIGYFASGIAHELNNPLQAIGAAAESLTSRLAEGSMGQELPKNDRELLTTYLGMIERESTRCQQITSRVLDFARGTNGPKMRQDLTKIVTEVLEMVTHMRRFDNRKIIFDRSQSHLVDISAAEMKQVVLNLVANGLESMNESGTLTIQIVETVDEVILSVQDDGCGMTKSVIENLYEPFFTEKQNGKGTGLGLSITHRIVGDHGGRIDAASEGPGCGSTFRVHLPRCCKSMGSAA